MTTPKPLRKLAAAADPGPSSIEDWIRSHQVALARYLRLLGAHDPDDLVQDTFVRFLQNHEPHPGSERLLRVIARGLWIDHQRWRARRAAREHADRIDAVVAAEPDQDPLSDTWLQALAECREALAPKPRTAIDRFYRDGLSRAQLATEIGMTEHGVRNLLARTRQVLKGCIESKTHAGDPR